MSAPALAVVGRDGRLERSTAAFSARDDAEALIEEGSPQLERVLRGEAASATVTKGGVTAAVEAVVDAAGGRHALLTLNAAPGSEATTTGTGNPVLDEDLDLSPAVVVLKDMDGRYMRVNAKHAELLGGGAAELVGHTDDDLPASLIVDGPRLRDRALAGSQPVQLEYIVPALDQRPALSVLRFAVHDRDGQPVAVCAVAMPLAEADIARAEAERLIGIERLAHLGPGEARRHLLDAWGLASPDVAMAESRPDPGSGVDLEGARTEPDVATAGGAGPDAAEALRQAEEARTESERLRRELERAHAEIERARAAAQREGEEAQAARASAHAARGEAGQALVKIEQLQAESLQLSHRLEQADAQAREWRQLAEQAEARAQDVAGEAGRARQRVAELEAASRQATATIEQLTGAERQARLEVEQLQLEVEALRTQAFAAPASDKATEEAAAAHQRLAGVEAERDAASAAAGELRETLAAEKARTEELRRELAAALERAELAVAAARGEEREARAVAVEAVRAEEREARELAVAAVRAEDQRARELAVEAARRELDIARVAVEEAQAARGQAERAQQALSEAAAAAQAAAEAAAAQASALKEQLARHTQQSAQARGASDAAAVQELRQRLATAQSERDAANAAAAELRAALAAETARTDELRRTLAEAHQQVAMLTANLEGARVRHDAEREAASALHASELQNARTRQDAELGRLQRELADERERAARVEHELDQRDAAATAAALARHPAQSTADAAGTDEARGPRWNATLQRALAASLGDVRDLRVGAGGAAAAIGAHGGWDLVAAWLPDARGTLRCAGYWSSESVRELEQLIVRAPGPGRKSRLGAALYARGPVWVTGSQAADDVRDAHRLPDGAAEAIATALVLPIRDGVARIGLLELLAKESAERDEDVVRGLEAAGLQVGQFVAFTRARSRRV